MGRGILLGRELASHGGILLGRELASHGERYLLVYVLPTHHGIHTVLPGTPRSPLEPAHGYPRTAGDNRLTALRGVLTVLSLPVTVIYRPDIHRRCCTSASCSSLLMPERPSVRLEVSSEEQC